ncbi:MAG: sulfite exporter TauE/SafE family protein [Granulosicoccaceae bacterium]
MLELISQELLLLTLLAIIVFVAGIVRGAIGFGFSALVVAAGTLFLPPSALVPMVVLLEIIASVQMLRSAWPSVHWRAHNWLLAALVVATPLGVTALSMAPDSTLRLIIAVLILAMASLMISGYRLSGDLGRGHLLSVGFVAGLFNGIAGIGGMPIAVYLSSSAISLAQMRATLVMLFFGTELLFILSALANDVYSRAIVSTAVAAVIPMALGIWLGSRIFERVDESKLRRATVLGIFILALLGLVRAVWQG